MKMGSVQMGKGKNVMAEAKAYKMIPHCTKDTITYDIDELVRCKDCKRYYANGGNCDQVLADWFCADGEAKS